MNVEKKHIKWIVIAFVIFVVTVFIIWKWRTKSEYVYPEATTTPPLGAIQVTSVVSVAATASTPYYLKVTTASAHGFTASASARDTVIFKGFPVADAQKAALNYTGPASTQFITYTPTGSSFTASEFAILVPPSIIAAGTSINWTGLSGVTVETGFNNYKNLLQAALDAYNAALVNSALGAFISGTNNKTTSDAIALTTKQSAYTTASTEYVQKKCPYANSTNPYIDTTGKPTVELDPALSEYNTYRTTNVAKIQSDYISLLASTTTTAVSGTAYNTNTNAVQQARKADITGATRSYLSKVCPGFYTDSTNSSTETTYKSWTTTSTAGTYYYANPTATKINNWAQFAVDTSIAGSINSDGKLVLSIARDLKGAALVGTTNTPKSTLVGSAVAALSGITSVVVSGTTATVTTPSTHGWTAGTVFISSGFAPVNTATYGLNGTFVVAATPAPTATTFTFTVDTGTLTATTLGTMQPLTAAITTTSPQMIVYTVGNRSTAVSKPAWQWARDYGPGTTSSALMPPAVTLAAGSIFTATLPALSGWGSGPTASGITMLVDTSTYVA